MTLVAVLLGALTTAGLTLAEQASANHPSADGYQPVVLLETNSPTQTGVLAQSAAAAATTSATTSSTTTTTTTTSATSTTTAPGTTTRTAAPITTMTFSGSPTEQVFQMVNAARAQAGCAALRDDSRLDSAAQNHSNDMANNHYFSHTTPEGITFEEREAEAGYPNPGGENIAEGQTSAQSVMAAWMGSSDHRANILNCQFTAMGVGLNTDGWYWTQDFGY